MISLKNKEDLLLMRQAGKITAGALEVARELVKPGESLISIDTHIRKFIEKSGAKPSFLGYGGFPASACISVNEEVIHGIPSDRRLEEGDIGKVSAEAERLERVTRESFFEGIKFADVNHRIGDISAAIQKHVEDNGFSVVRNYVGHGVGRNLHEDPEVPNFGRIGKGPRLYEGMTLAIEPMVMSEHTRLRFLTTTGRL